MTAPRRTTDLMALAWALVMGGCAQLEPDKTTAGAQAAAVAPAPVKAVAPAPPVAATPSSEPVVALEALAPAKEIRPSSDEVERLMSYFERLKRMPAAELTKEHEAARATHGRTATDYNRVSYAMTLSVPGTSVNDDARALELLNPLLKKTDNGLRTLVVLLTTFIQERRRLGNDLAAVQQKLDALKSLERTLIDRDQNNLGRKQ